jgi:N-glycosylase/DNA lyase
MERILRWYEQVRGIIEKRIAEFNAMRDASDERWFSEMAFCILVADGNAKTGLRAQRDLEASGMLYTGDYHGILRVIRPVRYNTVKARYILHDRKALTLNGRLILRSLLLNEWKLTDSSSKGVRDRIAKDHVHFLGLGMKEASHFLRNIGYGTNIAILDIHILTLMKEYNLLPERCLDANGIKRPSSLSVYHEAEEIFLSWADELGIPATHLDLTLWSLRTGEVIK